ncbi:glycoside hydrolase family 73 protein [Fructilactobacillus cliffordii]|uniref:glycoside hydrolase family 73 protein n=1 Tax=Fructilactobacillus cliffordii TaxID=2940299 RepID=UPI0020938328|nr:glycoside hydrolase family 73 protein [Fructilactobacillus cliffordii]USS86300.1 glycoside hydrolase family 73 protein [Fructilactobacillus cliffordii]
MTKKRRRPRRKRKTTKKKRPQSNNFSGFILIIVIVTLLAGTIWGINYITQPRYSQSNVSQQHQKFINQILPASLRAQREYKILPSITIAQAILESNWGQSQLSSQYHNLFGVKATSNQPSVELSTTEFTNGKAENVTGRFRVYASWDESIEAHAKLLANGTDWNNLQYQDVVRANNYQDAARALSTGGYATDPAYADKVIAIIEKYHLNQYDHQEGQR